MGLTQIISAVIIITGFLLAIFLYKNYRRIRKIPIDFDEEKIKLLAENVAFYQNLNAEKKALFEAKMKKFLSHVRITGVKTKVEKLDEVLVAAGAIIPIFAFKNWEYTNLNEVLLYPDSFNSEFHQQGNERSFAGMVGTGPMQNVMILSQHELRQGFLNSTDTSNTAIHEFVHLVDKTDGETDGIPENLMDQKYVLPWLEMIHKKINEIQEGKSDINPYGITNQAEFFAVASEYFFERPDLLKENHPELYNLLEKIFRQQPEA